MKTMTRKNKNLSHICQFSIMEIFFVSVIDYIPEVYLAIVRRKKKKKKRCYMDKMLTRHSITALRLLFTVLVF